MTERKNRRTCALESGLFAPVFPPFDFQNGGRQIKIQHVIVQAVQPLSSLREFYNRAVITQRFIGAVTDEIGVKAVDYKHLRLRPAFEPCLAFVVSRKHRVFTFLMVVSYTLSSGKRYVGGKQFTRNISNMTFFSSI